ncbi:MAG: hypothetical protein ACXIT9_04080 [Nitritalea sp.]
MSWKKISLVFVFGLLLSVAAEVQAQRFIDPEASPALKDRMYYGANLSLQFGTITFVDVSPLAGVMITEKFSAGLGGTYQYFNDRRFIGGDQSIFGGRIFTRYNVFPNIFAHAEYESLNLDVFNRQSEQFQREWVPGLFVGAGYFVPYGDRGGANFKLLYNLLYDNLRSPYAEPIVIRVGFVF